MLDTVRKYVEAGREALTPRKAEELARSLVKQGEARREQASKLARDLVEWSRKNSERLLEIVRGEVKKQISRAGLVTKDEVEGLKRRIRELEKGSRTGTAARPASSKATKSSARKRTTRSKPTARKTTAGPKPTASPGTSPRR
jgi:polyhydroxyalkanoate synthesis regulator phasin